jgi:benzil reductase ((S)-benzoin forming)
MEHLFIVTGSSRGLGRALVELLLEGDNELLCMSRSHSEELDRLAAQRQRRLQQWAVDLARPLEVAQRLEAWLRGQDLQRFSGLTLINNAAVLEDPGPFPTQPAATIEAALRVGLEAPILLTRALLAATSEGRLTRRVLNISSGLGRRALAGVTTYCAVKAGLDHFSRALAEECQALVPPAAVVALAPGIIDTGMQEQLRGADADAFAAQRAFAGFKASGELDSPSEAAARVLAYLVRADFGAQPVADVRD